jgi:hypothetical protein
MGMDKPDTPEARPACAFRRKGRYRDPMAIADNNVFDESPAVHDKTNLSRNFF